MADFEKYISATRRSLWGNVTPSMYDTHIKLANAIFYDLGKSADIKICYTSERRSEVVTKGDLTTIFYDQYLGQTLSNLSRIVHEADSEGFALNYCSKMLAEFFRAYGENRNAFVCARTHSEETWKLRNLTKKRKRLASVFFQERFLFLHEVYHFAIAKSPSLRFSVNDVLNEYFEYLRSCRAEHQEFEKDFLDMLAADPDDFSVSLKNEMVCDFFAYSVSVNVASDDNLILGRNAKGLAAIGCLEALNNSQIVHTLRDAVIMATRSPTESSETKFPTLIHDYRVRSRFMNWLCNTTILGVDRGSYNLVKEIDQYLVKYHDRLGVVAFSLCEGIIQGKFDHMFSEDARYVDELIQSGTVDMRVSSSTIDAMTGWYGLSKEEQEQREKISQAPASFLTKNISRISRLSRGS